MPKIVSLTLPEVVVGMQCGVAVYTSGGVKLVDRETVFTSDLIRLMQRNKISIVTVIANDSGKPNIAVPDQNIATHESTIKKEIPNNIMHENGKLILKIDSNKAKESHSVLTERIKNFFDNVKTSSSIDLTNIQQEVDSTLDSLFENQEAYLRLSMLKMKDQNLYIHSVDVCILASLIAQEYGFQKNDINEIAICALLHDIGKMLLPADLLNARKLVDGDLEMYKKHPFFGYEVLKKENFDERLANVIFEHHENFDGTGFPMKKYGVDSDIYSRIINISNAFNNLTKINTSYKAAQIITTEEKKKFDPDILQIFQKIIGIYPNDTYIKLSDGSMARVIEQNKSLPLRPIVALIRTSDGRDIDEPTVINLFERHDLIIKEILEV